MATLFTRSSGIVLHISSLPGRYGIGDLGPGARTFIRFLKKAGQSLWQTLPLAPTGYGNSPYAAYSAFAGNPNFISPVILMERGYLNRNDTAGLPDFPSDTVDYEVVTAAKRPLFHKAFQRFVSQSGAEERHAYALFCREHAEWLEDFALFMALKDKHDGAAWNTWSDAVKFRQPSALEHCRASMREELEFHKFLQFEFHRQWHDLRSAAHKAGIRLIGDIPIFLAYDSADVWAGKSNFRLRADAGPEVVAGVPPDYFSKTGQRWGNPHYNWAIMRYDGFSWWKQRFAHMFALFDIVRIDHFRGFEAAWEIDAAETTAVNGRWVKAPGAELFASLRQHFGRLPLIAEDLGTITPEVKALRQHFGFPGMKVLQFAYESGDPADEFLPHNFEGDCVVYTGTHDNDTTAGWYHKAPRAVKDTVKFYVGKGTKHKILWGIIRHALSSTASMCLMPLQDVLELDSKHRMNFPGKAAGNWRFRCTEDQLTGEMAELLAGLTRRYNR